MYLISLESCDIDLSNGICYTLVAILHPEIQHDQCKPTKHLNGFDTHCTFRRFVIMRVCVRLHGTLYPMTDCVLYLGRTIVLAVQPGSADVPQASLRFHYH